MTNRRDHVSFEGMAFEERAARSKPGRHSFEAMTFEEKAEFLRGQLFQTHKARGTPGIWEEMYCESLGREGRGR